MTKPSYAMLVALRSLRDHGVTDWNVRGLAEAGGHGQTVRALQRRGLIRTRHVDGGRAWQFEWVLTDEGRAAIGDPR